MLRKSHSLLLTVIAVTCFGLFGSMLSSEARFVDTASSTGNTLSSGSIAAPSNVTVTSGNPMVLNWTATPTTAADGYKIYRSATSGTLGALVATVTPRTTVTWTDNAPLDGNNYYVVKAYKQNWVSGYVESPGVGAVTVTDNFNGTGAPAATETGSKTWTAYNGTFNKTGSGTATASVAAGASPFLTVPMPSGDVDVRTDVTGARSGEAVYFRVVDNNDWSRLRLRRDDYTYQYYNTEYQHTSYTTEYEYDDIENWGTYDVMQVDYEYSTTTYGSWSAYADDSGPYCQTNPPSTPAGSDTVQYSTRAGTSCTSGTQTRWFITKSTRTKTTSTSWCTRGSTCSGTATGASRTTDIADYGPIYPRRQAFPNGQCCDYVLKTMGNSHYGYYWGTTTLEGDARDLRTGNTRQVANGTYWDGNFCSGCPTRQVGPYTGNATNYYLHLEKSVAGTITVLGSWSVGAINGFRVTAVGSTITCFADASQVAVVTDATNLTANLHGVGLGGTDTDSPTNAITYAYLKSL